MACECAICKNNKPFTFPKEIIDAALDGELVLFAVQELVPKAKMFYHTRSTRLSKMS